MSPTSRHTGGAGATTLVAVAEAPTPEQRIITWWDATAPPPLPSPNKAVKPVPPDGRPLSSSRVIKARGPSLRSAARRAVLTQRQESSQDLASPPLRLYESHDRKHDDDHNHAGHGDGGDGTRTGTVHPQSFESDPASSSSNRLSLPPPPPPPRQPPSFPTDRQVNQKQDAAAIAAEYHNSHPPSEPTSPSGPLPPQRDETKPAIPEFTAPAIRTATVEHQPMHITTDLPHRGSPAQSTPAADPMPIYPSLTQVDVPPTISRVQATWPPQDTASAAAPILSEPSQRISDSAVISSEAATLSTPIITATYSNALSMTPSATTDSRSKGLYNSLFGVRAGQSRSAGTNYNEPEPTLNAIDRESNGSYEITPTIAAKWPTETGRIEPTSSRHVGTFEKIEVILKSVSLPGLGDSKDPPVDDEASQSGNPIQRIVHPDSSDVPPPAAPETTPANQDAGGEETQKAQGGSITVKGIPPVSVAHDPSGGSPRSVPTPGIPPPVPPPPKQPPTVTTESTMPPPVVPNNVPPQPRLPIIRPALDPQGNPVTEAAAPTSGAPQIASQPGTPITGHQKVVSGDLDDTSIATGGENGVVRNPNDSQTGSGQDNTGRLPSIVSGTGSAPNRPAQQPGSPAAPGAAGNIGDAAAKQAGGSNVLSASAMGGLVGAALVFLVAVGVVTVAVRRRHRRRHIHTHGKRAYSPFDDDDLRPMTVAKSAGFQMKTTAEDVEAYTSSLYPSAQPARAETVDAFSPDYNPFHHQEILRGYFTSNLSVNTAPLVPLPSSTMVMPALQVIPPTPRDSTSDSQSDDSPFSDRHASSDMHETISTDSSPYSDRRASTKTASTTDSAMPLRVYSSLLRSGHSSSSMASDAAAAGAAGGTSAGGANAADCLLKPPSPHRRLAHRLSTTSTSSMYSTLSTALRALHWRRSDKAQQRTQRRWRKLLISSASLSSMSSATTNGTTSSLSGRSFATTTVTSCDDYASSCDNTTAWGGSEAGTDSSCTEFQTVLTGTGAGGLADDDNASDLDVWLDEGDDDGGIDEIVIVPAQRPLPFPPPIRGS
ncbi:hypothetical protein BDZ88DRAFT_425249 [Geranomyces variabilis]|nr:hypothetical protein BDZ88DRAFT_425249 [Geranomyces variabilis]KAJ3143687.1 hypothetical protein HDU90_000452 [Geranomyces variabilis]